MALQPECEAMIGAFVSLMTSQKVVVAECETSTIMPSRFISATTCFPKGESPLLRGGLRSLDESPIWLWPLWVSEM